MKINNIKIYGVIYKITNIVNGKIYIGQTTRENGFDDRYKGGLEKTTHNKHLKRAIKKYGIENFNICKTFDIAFSKEELDIKEDCWISIYNSMNPKYGYNKQTGGSHGKPNSETRNKISISKQGKHCSEETKLKMSKAHLGYNPTKETRELLKIINLGSNNPYAIKVICITTGKIFGSIKEGANYYNLKTSSGIIACCKNKRKSSGKLEDGTLLQWMYYEDYLKLTKEDLNNILIKQQRKNKLKKEIKRKKKEKKIICLDSGKYSIHYQNVKNIII